MAPGTPVFIWRGPVRTTLGAGLRVFSASHPSSKELKSMRSILSGALASCVLFTLVSACARGAEPVGTAFTYQGKLSFNGTAANAAYDFRFAVFDTDNVPYGPPVQKLGVPISNGLFTVTLDFGVEPFFGDALEMEIQVRTAGGNSYTTLTPRQRLTPAPFAVLAGSASGLRVPVDAEGAAPGAAALRVKNVGAAVSGALPIAIEGIAQSNDSGIGVFGSVTYGTGVYGSTSTITPPSLAQAGVVGQAGTQGHGVLGAAKGLSYAGVWGTGLSYGIYGTTTDGHGVNGLSNNGTGVRGSGGQYGMHGYSPAVGIYAENTATSNKAYLATSYAAADFKGDVAVYGTLTKLGGSFKIDHPLDPENKWLSHSFVESPDMKNLYDGVVTLDENGEATIEMPEWFEALNRDFRYQLTCVGGWAPVYVSKRIAGNRFSIAGGSAGLEVSWLVTGTRHDTWASENRIPLEETKTPAERAARASR
jgi:hypothetical protein